MPRVQILRSITSGNRPSGKLYGEPYVNVADNQFGVMDSSNVARDLIGVPMFSAAKSYAIGNAVNYQGLIYIAQVVVPAGAWNPAQWSQVATVASVPAPSTGAGHQNGLVGSVSGAFEVIFSVTEVTLRNAQGVTAIVSNANNLINNLNTAGAGGLDVAAVIPSGSWVHYYWILTSNKATIQTIASLTAPPTGPVLPTGYTYVAYIGAIFYLSGSLKTMFIRGAQFFYQTWQSALSGGTSGGVTGLSVATLVPPNASSWQVHQELYGSADVGVYQSFVDFYLATQVTYNRLSMFTDQNHGSVVADSFDVPNISQQFGYGVATGGHPSILTTIYVRSYIMPNGDS